MKPYHFAKPPPALSRARLDNLALVPGSLLPYRNQWQALANSLPQGEVLIVLPTADTRPKRTLETVATQLRAKGYEVTTCPADRFAAA